MEKTKMEALVIKAVNGSGDALENIIKQIQDPIYALSLRMLFHPEDAQDATQEILIKIITSLTGFRFEGSFLAWVMRIAANHLKAVRKKKVKRLQLTMKKAQETIDRAEAKGWLDTPMEAPQPFVEAEMLSACTQALLQALNRSHRIVFILGTVIEVSGVDGAYILDISPVAFRKRLSRARNQIRNFLSTNCGFFDGANRCTCTGVYAGHVDQGWMNPEKPLFVSRNDQTENPTRLRHYMQELDELGKISLMFKTFPPKKSARYVASMVKELVQKKNYRILTDPKVT
jgi:RNA polymerase sigma factor (sigma-70 family)